MRNFFAVFVKNALWAYLVIIICFGYALMLEDVPTQIHVTQEEIDDGTAAEYLDSCKLLGVIPVKDVSLTICSREKIYPCGRVVGIYGQTRGVLVLSTTSIEGEDGKLVAPATNLILPGDYIYAVNGEPIETKEELVNWVNNYCKWNRDNGTAASEKPSLRLSVHRQEDDMVINVPIAKTAKGEYKLGIWVKDDLAGIGTVTFYRENGDFGALGHGIGDGETGQILGMSQGKIYRTEIVGIKKGQKGEPGEIEGVIYYGLDDKLGTLNNNGQIGLFGTLDAENMAEFRGDREPMEVAYKQEIEIGKAQIMSDVSGELQCYEVEITDVDFRTSNSNKGIHLTVTDPDLLELTGGIVQGMSGSPIIQNGRIVGAVTHVLVSDSAKGYGIFIENMLEY